MADRLDARGLACPQPVLLVLEKLRTQEPGVLEVLVDSASSRDNVARAAASLGWRLQEVQAEGQEFRLTLEKG